MLIEVSIHKQEVDRGHVMSLPFHPPGNHHIVNKARNYKNPKSYDLMMRNSTV